MIRIVVSTAEAQRLIAYWKHRKQDVEKKLAEVRAFIAKLEEHAHE